MYFLVRKLTGRSGGEALETEYQGDVLTLGGVAGAMVNLPGVPGLLELTPDASGARFNARRMDVGLGGEVTRKGLLAPGESLQLPGFELSLFAPPQGFELALQLKQTGASKASYGGAMELSATAWSVRGVSWTLALLVLVTCLLIPLAGLFSSDVAQTLRATPLPDDGLWLSGPLIAAHDTSDIADDCQACHTQAFVMVEDGACLACHRGMTEHVDIAVHPAEAFAGVRCATCHREHNEPQQMVRSDNGLCVDCHADTAQWSGVEDMLPVHRFTAADHPEFKFGLLTPQGPGGAYGWEVERVRPDLSTLNERSNLKFTHEVHLDPEKVRAEASGEGLVCASCHTLKDDGEHFEPVSMDQHCRSCHTLSFDIFDPDIELPHGDLRAAIVAMEAHFIREFTDPALRKEREGQKPRRVPGKRDAAASCEGNGLDCGRAEALKEAEYQFANTGCITCHVVVDTGARDINDRWRVQPIRITDDWYPHGRFDHTSHLILDGKFGEEACESCHQAHKSTESTDILIPGRDNCLTCHADGVTGPALGCIDCHIFHTETGSVSAAVRKVRPASEPGAPETRPEGD